MSRPEKYYPCFGYEVTVREAADAANASPASLKTKMNRLGSMEAAVLDYEKRYGGVVARMENIVKNRGGAAAVEEKAKREILQALGYADENQTEIEDPEDARDECTMATSTGLILPCIAEELTYDAERKALALYNMAIEGLKGLVEEEGFEKSGEHKAACRLLEALGFERRTRFEPMIDWNALAGRKI